MTETKFNFGKRGYFDRIMKSQRNSKFSCGLIIILFISSLIFGFLGGVVGVYSLSGKQNLEDSKIGLDLIGKKTYKVTEESAIIEATKKVSPSVVSITVVSSIRDFFGQSRTQKSSGSGFILTSDGLIMTNKHVVSDSVADYTVFTSDGKGYTAKVVTFDPFNDLALIKIETKNLTPVTLSDSDELQIGQKVIAIGNALGFQNSVTSGIISAKERAIEAGDTSGQSSEKLEGLLQTDAAINSGNSGGPLVNLDGQVIGINTAVADKGVAEGIGFAIPVNVAKSAIESYKKSGKIIRPFIGVRYVILNKEIAEQNKLSSDTGAWVTSAGSNEAAIVANSPAAKAGLKEDDIILAVNGEKIDENHSLSRLIQQYHPGETVELTFLREGKENKTKVKLTEYKE